MLLYDVINMILSNVHKPIIHVRSTSLISFKLMIKLIDPIMKTTAYMVQNLSHFMHRIIGR